MATWLVKSGQPWPLEGENACRLTGPKYQAGQGVVVIGDRAAEMWVGCLHQCEDYWRFTPGMAFEWGYYLVMEIGPKTETGVWVKESEIVFTFDLPSPFG